MKKPVILDAVAIPALSEFQDMPQEFGKPIARTRSGEVSGMESEGAMVGIWECSPGIFRRQVTKREFCHFSSGHCFFIPVGQSPIEIRAGDTVYFPADCDGVWDVRETLRKTYMIVD